MDLTLEVGDEPRSHVCPDCGGVMRSIRGFVYRSGDAYAIYFATLPLAGHEARADLAIGIGNWAEGMDRAELSGFMQVWPTADEYQMGFVDPSSSGWSSSRLLGGRLSADEARSHERRAEFFEVADLILRNDPGMAF